jgi:thymidylate synthase
MHFHNIDSAWVSTLEYLMQHGKDLADDSRDGAVALEVLDYSFSLDASKQCTFLRNPTRNISMAYAAAETLWYMSDTPSVEMLQAYAPSYKKFADANGNAHGAYGPRVMEQLPDVIKCLQNSPRSRQTVVSVWRRDDLNKAVAPNTVPDLPCTLHWQFMIRQCKLHMIVSMRSNDVWLGLPYDVFAFTCFQRIIANMLGVEVGPYYHHAGSMHLYQRNMEAAHEAAFWRVWKNPQVEVGHGWSNDDNLQSVRTAVTAERLLREGHPMLYGGCGSMGTDLVRACNTKLKQPVDLGPFTSGVFDAKVLDNR